MPHLRRLNLGKVELPFIGSHLPTIGQKLSGILAALVLPVR